MTITMGAAQTVLRVPKGTIWTLQLSISHTGAKRHNPHESFPVRHCFNSLFLCNSTNKGRQIKNHLKSICDLMNHYGSFPLAGLWTLTDKLLYWFIFAQISIFFYCFATTNFNRGRINFRSKTVMAYVFISLAQSSFYSYVCLGSMY